MNLYGSSMTGSAVCPTSPKGVIRRMNSDSALRHYGVLGQKWGVITKEYQPVAFDKRKIKKSESDENKINHPISRSSFQAQNGNNGLRRQSSDFKSKYYNQDIRRLSYVGGALLGLLVAYGAYKYVRVTKAKAYSGILTRFLKQNPTANLQTESGRQLLRQGVRFAKENSKNLSTARATNAYLKRKGLGLSAKNATALYKSRNLIKNCASYADVGSRFKQVIFNARKSRLMKKLLI